MSELPSRSYLAIASAIVVAGILISASLFLALGEAGKTTITTETSVSTSTKTVTGTATSVTDPSSGGFDCADAGVWGSTPPPGSLPLVTGNDLYQCERVLVLPPGSTGVLVVSYQTDLSVLCPRSEGCTPIANLTASILAPDWSHAVTIPEQVDGYVNATGVTISANPASVNVTAVGYTSITVAYTIKASSGVSGMFELQYLDACPTMIPLSVGYTASQLNASSFPDYQPFLQGCIQLGMLSGGSIMSMSGFQTAWLVQSIQQQNGTIG